MFVQLVTDNVISKSVNLNHVKEITYDKDYFKLEWITGGFAVYKNTVTGKGLSTNGDDLLFDNIRSLRQYLKIN